MPEYVTVKLKNDEGKEEKVRFKKGALHKQLGYPENKTIPRNVFTRVQKAKEGTTLKINGKDRKVTALMKRRVNFALVLMKGNKKK
tara:strand:+ start:3391 stop:3648 length:258 start_codon:yes stop_codon:yes gene_type:complete